MCFLTPIITISYLHKLDVIIVLKQRVNRPKKKQKILSQAILSAVIIEQ